MNNLRIPVEVSSLTKLELVGPDIYRLEVWLYDDDGNVMVDPNVPASPMMIDITTMVPSFILDIPIVNGDYTLIGKAKVMARADEECCAGEGEFSLVNTENDFEVSPEAVLFNGLSDAKVYSYEPSTETLTELFLGTLSDDVAHTPSKLFIYNLQMPGPVLKLHEYDITLSPFTKAFNQTHDLTWSIKGAGLCAVSNTLLYMAGYDVVEIDLSGPTIEENTLFSFGNLYQCTGDLVYDPATELFLATYHNTNTNTYKIGVINRSGTVIREVITPIVNIFGIYQFDGDTFVVTDSGAIHNLNLTTLATTPADSVGVQLAGASQIQSNISIPA